jgi:hypothetical protein
MQGKKKLERTAGGATACLVPGFWSVFQQLRAENAIDMLGA